ncbi:MFS transporter [Mycoplasmatota bacterium]|nr:MFS transporter [Mycoplasmatota bacterium]
MNEKIKIKEIASYGLAGMGQNMVYILSSSFLMIFYTDVFGINARTVGTLFLVARVWDAINDFIMGSVVDNTRTRWGKLRPYLLIAPIPIAVLTILTFLLINYTYSLKIVYIFVTYILWGMVYTIGDVPYWGLSASMSSDTSERTRLITFTRFMTMVGSGASIVGIPLLVENLGNGSEKQGYLLTAIIVSIIGCSLFSLAYFNTKERVIPQKEKVTLIENMKLFLKNTPLLIILFSSILGFSRFMSQSAGTYVTKYNLHDSELYSLLGGVLITSVLFAIIITPLLLKFFTKRNLYILTSIFGAIMYFLMYLTGYDSLIDVLTFVFFSSLSMGFFNVLQTSMIADSVDYLEWKTGKRAEGLCYASQTFFFKLSGGLTNFTMGMVLYYTGFVKDSPNQLPQVYHGIFSLVSLIPGIGCILSIIPMFFYKYTDKDQRYWVEEIKHRKDKMKEKGNQIEESMV